MTFGETVTDNLNRLGFKAGDTDATSRIKRFINETHREILRNKHFQVFRRRLVTTACIANIPYMAIPRGAVRIFTVQDRTNQWLLKEKDLLWIRSNDPALSMVTANPWAYAIADLASPVLRQPSDASQLFIKSTSVADTTQSAFIEGIRSGGDYQAESKVLTGTTAGGFAKTDTVAVNKFFLSAVPAGDVSLIEDSGVGTVLATIIAGRTYSRYALLHLYPTPSAAITYYCDIEVHVEDMVQDSDECLFPEEFHHLLGLGVRKKEYEKREKVGLVKMIGEEIREEVSKLRTWVNRQTGFPSSEGDNRRFSQLGPYYESGT